MSLSRTPHRHRHRPLSPDGRADLRAVGEDLRAALAAQLPDLPDGPARDRVRAAVASPGPVPTPDGTDALRELDAGWPARVFLLADRLGRSRRAAARRNP